MASLFLLLLSPDRVPAQTVVPEGDPLPKPPYRLFLSNTIKNNNLNPPVLPPGEHGVAWVYPEEAFVGDTVRIGGFGFGTDPSQVTVWFTSWEKRAQGKVVSVQNGEIRVVVPVASLGVHIGSAYWGIEVLVGGRPMAQNQGPDLLVRNIPPAPPDVEPAVNPEPWYNSYPDHLYIGAVGDVVEIVGHGFSTDPAQNLINFGGASGASARPAAVDFVPRSTYYQIATVTVPPGAVTGPVSAARLDGIPGEWGQIQPYVIIAPTEVVLSADSEGPGFLVPYFLYDAGLMTQRRQIWSHSWIIRGKNLSRLKELTATLTTFRGTYRSDNMAVLSDTRALIHADYTLIEAVLNGLAPGAGVKLRLEGKEKDTNLPRQSNEITLPFGGQPVEGGVWSISAGLGAVTNPLEVPRGDWLCVSGSTVWDQGDVQTLRAEALWEGSLAFGSKLTPPYDLVHGRCTVLTQAGMLTITNETSGKTLQVRVKDEGVPSGLANTYLSTKRCAASAEGVTIGFGGARLIIPPGALPANGCYRVSAEYKPRLASLFDPEQDDGGNEFWSHIGFSPDGNDPLTDLNQLLKPIHLVLPYGEEGREPPITAGVLDTTSGVYRIMEDIAVDSANRRIILTIPAGIYGTIQATSPKTLGATGPAGGFPTAAPLATGLAHVGVVSPATVPCPPLEDGAKRFRVEYTCDPASSSYVTTAYANEVLNQAVNAYATLGGQGWIPLPGQQSITIRNYGPWTPASGYAGATTKGVFGQPWIYLNSQVPAGDHLAATTSHEVGHAFQRQYTTNITTKWNDEASAVWAAWEATGNAAGLKPMLENGIDFIEQSLPAGFSSGYDTEQAYAAGALMIWMEDVYPNSNRRMYEAIDACWTSLCWDDTYGILRTATGKDIWDLSKDFALAFWRQSFDPLPQVAVPVRDRRFSTLPGSKASAAPPAYSSIAWKMGPNDALYASEKARTYVLRVQNLDPAMQTLYVLGEPASFPSGGLPLLKEFKFPPGPGVWISGTIGDYQTYRTHRVLLVNHGTNTPTVNVELVTPHITSIAPSLVPKSGGTAVTINGGGFGTRPGQVRIDNGTYSVTTFSNWTDTGVTFTMPNMGTMTGPVNVQLRTLESDNSQADSNVKVFTLY